MGVGRDLYMYDVVVKKFTFANSSLDEFLVSVLPSAPTTIGIILVGLFTFQSHFSSRARFWYLSTFSCFCASTLVSPRALPYLSKSAAMLSFSTTTISGHVCSITWSVWILTSQRILTFFVSITGSPVCRYHCSEYGMLYFSHRLQWTIPTTLSRLFLYSSCASLLHSLVKCATVSSLSLHILHLTSPSCLSIFLTPGLVLFLRYGA